MNFEGYMLYLSDANTQLRRLYVVFIRCKYPGRLDFSLNVSRGAGLGPFITRFIINNITRSLIIFGINKTDVSYRLLSNISALPSKSHWQSENFENDFWKVKPKY